MRKKTKVFVDAEALVATHFSGIGHYTLELLRALDDLLDTRNDVVVELGTYFRRINYIHKYQFKNFRIRRSPIPLRIANGLKLRNRQFYYDFLFGKRIYIFPNYTTWPLAFSKSLSVVYDLSFEFFPQYVEPNNQRFLSSQVKKTIARSTKIITISKNSQDEIVDFYKIPRSKTAIINPGVDLSVFFHYPDEAIARIKARYGIHGKYILFVGNIEPRKNLKNLLLAYETLPDALRKEYSLLLVGARGWLDNEIFDIIERLRINGNFIQQPVGYVKDEDRAALFSGASLFVYPSLYEGFGIPPIEAMACGVPVITSDNSSLPEAVGSAAVMVPADSVKKLANAMQKVLTNPEMSKVMIEEGFKQAERFSWHAEAKKLLELILETSRE